MSECNGIACSTGVAADGDRNLDLCARLSNFFADGPVCRTCIRIGDDDCAVFLSELQPCAVFVADFEFLEGNIVFACFARSGEVQVEDSRIIGCLLVAGGTPNCDLLSVIGDCAAGITVRPLNAVEGQLGICIKLNENACGTFVAVHGDRNLNLFACCNGLSADHPVRGACIADNGNAAVCLGKLEVVASCVGNLEILEGDIISASFIRCSKVQIENNCIVSCLLILTVCVCPNCDRLILIEFCLAGVALSPGNAVELERLIISKLCNDTGSTLVAADSNRNLNLCACSCLFLTDHPVCGAGRNICSCLGAAGCRIGIRRSRSSRFGSGRSCIRRSRVLNNLNHEAVEDIRIDLAVFLRNSLVILAVSLCNQIRAGCGRSGDLEGVDDRAICCLLLFRAAHAVDRFARNISCFIELRSLGVCDILFRLCAAVQLNLAEVEAHLDTCGTRVILNGPVYGEISTRSDLDNVVVGRIVRSLGIVAACRNKIVDNRILRISSNLDRQAVEQELVLNAVLLRNNLIDVLRIADDADCCGTGFRCLNLEAVDNRIIVSLLFLVAAERVIQFTRSLRIGIIDLRSSRISIAFFLTCIGNAGEVEVHLKTCSTLVVSDSPVNNDLLTSRSGHGVVAGHIISNGRLCAMRNEVINNHLRAVNLAALGRIGRLLGGVAGGRCASANIDRQAVEQELMLNAVLLRNNLIDVLRIADDADCCGTGFRCLNLEAVDNRIIVSLLFLVAAERVIQFTRSLRIGIIDLRSSRISIAFFLTCIGNAGEVEVHLKTCSTLVVSDSPVNNDLLTSRSGHGVVAGHIISNGRLCAMRNEVINNHLRAVNLAALGSSCSLCGIAGCTCGGTLSCIAAAAAG